MQHTRNIILESAASFRELAINLERLANAGVGGLGLSYVNDAYDLAYEAMHQIEAHSSNYPLYGLITTLKRDISE